MDRALRYLYRRLGRRYPLTVVVLQFQLAHLVVLGGLVLLRLYQPMSNRSFVVLLVVAELLVALDNVSSTLLARRLLAPVDAWLNGARDRVSDDRGVARARVHAEHLRAARAHGPDPARDRARSACSRRSSSSCRSGPPSRSSPAMLLTLLYGALFRFFAMESLLRPVLADVALHLSDDFEPGRGGVPLRRRLLVGAAGDQRADGRDRRRHRAATATARSCPTSGRRSSSRSSSPSRSRSS